jgi:TonB family protein
MRLMTFATLALLPTAAFAQANQSTLQASVAQPAFVRAAAPASTPAAAPTAGIALPVYHDVIKSSLVTPELDATMATGGSIIQTVFADDSGEYSIKAPQLVHVVGRDLPVSELASSDADVTVAFIVDNKGVPSDFKVVHSAGAAVDKGTLDALRQYRFKPATLDKVPVVAHLELEIKLKK